jgi:hypothetical protein
MTAPAFDATRAIRFDLTEGSVRANGQDEPLVLVPSSALSSLLASGPAEAAETFGRTLGGAIGRRAAAEIDDLATTPIETFVTQLAGHAALLGVGSLSIERWGRALVIVLERSPLAALLLAPLVAAALETASGRKVWSVLLSNEEGAARILVASQGGVERVRNWLTSGLGWRDALAKLQGGAA